MSYSVPETPKCSSTSLPDGRGAGRSPPFVKSRGIEAADAARPVQQMHWPHRILTLLARVDRLARGAAV
jgi:hypothetical protein